MLMAAKRPRRALAGDVRARRLEGLASDRADGVHEPLAEAQLAQIQRARLLAAMVSAACERGAAGVTVADVTSRCGVSRRTFYELFEDREDCFAAACEDALSLAAGRVLPAVDAERRWLDRVRAGLAAFTCFLDEEPKLGRLLLCESLVAGKRVLDRRMRVTGRLAEFVREGRHEGKLAAEMPLLYAEGAVGGILSILQNLLTSGHSEPYVKLAAPLTAMIVMPYVGPAAAARELDRPLPTATIAHNDNDALADPFKHAGVRLTYRTMRVLIAIGEHPNASNRTIGETSGIRDQGQVSKLLARLARAGLTANTGLGPGQGGPNAWALTNSGQRAVRSIRTHTNTHPQNAGKAPASERQDTVTGTQRGSRA
jgi:AcrR family transcriptional regulator